MVVFRQSRMCRTGPQPLQSLQPVQAAWQAYAGGRAGCLDAAVLCCVSRVSRRVPCVPPGMSRQAAQQLQQHLERTAASNAASPSHARLQEQCGALPAAAAREECMRLLQQHQVLVVTGETGCGKSTQVPQFILQAAQQAGRLAATNIVVSQPRRLITTSLSKRVAEERGEAVGDVVGYSIHGDRRTGRLTRLTFCTTGILIRRLMVDPALSNVSHVIIDEVHERGLEVDFLLAAMRELAAARPDLKLLLMSATLNSANITDYFAAQVAGSVGCLHIPGRTYHVEQFYLEDLIEARLRTALAAEAAGAAAAGGRPPRHGSSYGFQAASFAAYTSSSNGGPPAASAAAARAAARLGELMPEEARLAVEGSNARLPPTPRDWDDRLKGYQPAEDAHLAEHYSPATVAEVQRWAVSVVKPRFKDDLRKQHAAAAVAAIQFICRHEADPGSVLVFLPNWQAIADVNELLMADQVLAAGLQVFVLHSLLPMQEQQEAFTHAPPGFRKVILATNIAESSITFDDVAAVVDSCRVNLADFDAVNNLPTLGPQARRPSLAAAALARDAPHWLAPATPSPPTQRMQGRCWLHHQLLTGCCLAFPMLMHATCT
ncbi:P-loop containing nucleoside triphosphate hydrolase protein [Scenedesmus sp. NREL 46B-D3]|nr:P-loop containing nucleoside triphosphate hydrolase protein [Scenedesmus sp. NREL 46B-D3]